MYDITCDSMEAEILWARVEDIQKILKGEKRVVKFLNE